MPVVRKLHHAVEHIRRRPAMYFGNGDRERLPRFIRSIVYGVLSKTPKTYTGPLLLAVGEEAGDYVVNLEFPDLNLPLLAPEKIHLWEDRLVRLRPGLFGAAIAASEFCGIESSDGEHVGHFQFKEAALRLRSTRTRSSPFLRMRFKPDCAVFARAGHDELYKIAGCLQDFAALRAGLSISFRSEELEITYCYKRGLQSLLFETDYQRYSSHRGCLHFKARKGRTSIEGCLRFLHAGVPHMRTFVNYQPTQGGADLVGLGRALKHVFPDDKSGCRTVTLVTDPDRNLSVSLPRPFIGAMHFQSEEAKFSGPTTDILWGDDVSDFIFHGIKDQLSEQWARLQAQRML